VLSVFEMLNNSDEWRRAAGDDREAAIALVDDFERALGSSGNLMKRSWIQRFRNSLMSEQQQRPPRIMRAPMRYESTWLRAA